MTHTEATAEVFMTAFLSLPNREQETFLSRLLKSRRLREDLIDLAIAEERRQEKTKPFDKVMSEIRNSR